MITDAAIRKVLIAALLLVALMMAYLLYPTEGGDTVFQHIANKYITNSKRKLVSDGNPSEATTLPGASDHRNVNNHHEAAAAIALNSQEQFSALIEKAKPLGVSVRWIPALRRAMLSGRDTAVRELLSGDEFADLEIEYNILMSLIPEKSTEHIIGPSGRPFFNTALKWMGIEENDKQKGQGVKIALLDTAIDMSASTLENANIVSYDLFGLGTEPGSHGTMVASLLAGSDELNKVQGTAKGAEIISIPVMASDGNGYVFTLAEGIVAAADSGAKIISMSVSCQYDSAVLHAAVDYAISKGCVIVAAAGNEGVAVDGTSTVGYPAAYEGVIAVGAVNAEGGRAGFSSTGNELTLVAPGVGVFAETSEENGQASGTSVATPLVAGAIAYVMSEKDDISAIEAAKLLLEHTNDAGMPGVDDEYGLGQLSVERALKSDVQGYNDYAAADVVLKQNDDGGLSVYFSGQNRGNESIDEMVLHCTLYFGDGEPITEDIAFNDVTSDRTVSLKMDVPDGTTPIYAELSVSSSSEDANIQNNTLRRTLRIIEKIDKQ